MGILAEWAWWAALEKIHRREMRDAKIGQHKENVARANQAAAQNEIAMRRLMAINKKMTLWRNRNRKCK